jgi:hypothetical protein
MCEFSIRGKNRGTNNEACLELNINQFDTMVREIFIVSFVTLKKLPCTCFESVFDNLAYEI